MLPTQRSQELICPALHRAGWVLHFSFSIWVLHCKVTQTVTAAMESIGSTLLTQVLDLSFFFFFFSKQKLYFISFTTKLMETKFLSLCMPRGDTVVIKSLAPISCLKEIRDYKWSKHEACREALLPRLTGWVKEQTNLLLSGGYRRNLEAKGLGSGLFTSQNA